MTVDAILAEFAVDPEWDEVISPTVTMRLRYPTGAAAQKALFASAGAFYESQKDGRFKAAWGDAYPENEGDFVNAYLLTKIVVTPELSQQDALRLCRDAGGLVNHILDVAEKHAKSASAIAENKYYDAVKNALGVMHSGGSCSASPETSTEDTSTS